MADSSTSSLFSKDNPFPAKITENRLLSKAGSAKETRHFVINIAGSGLTYKAGDSLGVFPTNRPLSVAGLIERLGASGDELVSPAALKLAAPIKLYRALSQKLAIGGPTPKILETLLLKTTDAGERARLAELLKPEAKDQLAGYLDEREYLDVLHDFPGVRLTPQEFVDHLRKLMPRLYSIASSSKVYPGEVHLTVAVVRYTKNHRERHGVCSTFLGDRAHVDSTPVPVFVASSHFGPPEDTSRDVIMVGPGTGIAPFRAFVQDRVAAGATGRNWVFFGDQKSRTDFIYQDEWEAHLAGGRIARLDLAWSRDQLLKVYVQDRMREQAAELWNWIKNGACFFVCGDAKRMAKDVDVALHEVIARQGGMSPEQAADYVKQMKKDKRYQRDVY